jgi:hypothetical protein
MASEEYLLDNQIEYDTKLCQLKLDANLCQNTNINKEKDSYIMKKLLIFLCSLSCLGYLNADSKINCPHCQEPIQFRGLWGDTWTCPNTHCGYENYEAVSYCGICGTYRYAK